MGIFSMILSLLSGVALFLFGMSLMGDGLKMVAGNKLDRVKVTLRFRGREMAHMASSRHVLDDFAKQLADVATVEKAPKVEGRSMTMFLTEKR